MVDRDTPDPVLKLADLAELDSLLVPQSYLFVAARHDEVLTARIELNGARVKTKVFVSADRFDGLASLNVVEGELLIPTACNQQVVICVEFLRTER